MFYIILCRLGNCSIAKGTSRAIGIINYHDQVVSIALNVKDCEFINGFGVPIDLTSIGEDCCFDCRSVICLMVLRCFAVVALWVVVGDGRQGLTW